MVKKVTLPETARLLMLQALQLATTVGVVRAEVVCEAVAIRMAIESATSVAERVIWLGELNGTFAIADN